MPAITLEKRQTLRGYPVSNNDAQYRNGDCEQIGDADSHDYSFLHALLPKKSFPAHLRCR